MTVTLEPRDLEIAALAAELNAEVSSLGEMCKDDPENDLCAVLDDAGDSVDMSAVISEYHGIQL